MKVNNEVAELSRGRKAIDNYRFNTRKQLEKLGLPTSSEVLVKTCKETLKNIIEKHSVVRGKAFKMASGQTSDILIDLSTALRTSDGQKALIGCLKEIFDKKFDAVGGPLSGSDLVSIAFVNAGLTDKFFGIRKEEKGRGLDEGLLTGNISKNDKILLVEDVCTIGTNTERAINAVSGNGYIIEGLFSVVDRGGLKTMGDKYHLPYYNIFSIADFD